MPWSFLTKSRSSDESVLDIEGAYFSDKELDDLGIDAESKHGRTESLVRKQLAAIEADRNSEEHFQRTVSPRLENRLRRLELVSEGRSSSRTLMVDVQDNPGVDENECAARTPSLTPTEGRRPLSVRNSSSTSSAGKSSFRFDDGSSPTQESDDGMSDFTKASSPRQAVLSQAITQSFNSPRDSAKIAIVPRRRSQVDRGAHRREELCGTSLSSTGSVPYLGSTSSDGVSIPPSLSYESGNGMAQGGEDTGTGAIRSALSFNSDKSSPDGLKYCYSSSSCESNISSPRSQKEARVQAIIAKSSRLILKETDEGTESFDDEETYTRLPEKANSEEDSVHPEETHPNQTEPQPVNSNQLPFVPQVNVPQKEMKDPSQVSQLQDSDEMVNDESIDQASQYSQDNRTEAASATEETQDVGGRKTKGLEIVADSTSKHSNASKNVSHDEEWVYQLWERHGIMKSRSASSKKIVHEYNAKHGARPKVKLVPGVSVPRYSAGLSGFSTRSTSHMAKSKSSMSINRTSKFGAAKAQNTLPVVPEASSTKIVTSVARRKAQLQEAKSTPTPSISEVNKSNGTGNFGKSKKKFYTAMGTTEEDATSATSLLSTRNGDRIVSHGETAPPYALPSKSSNSVPVSAKKPGFANLLKKWKDVTHDKPCSHFLSPHNSPLRPARKSLAPHLESSPRVGPTDAGRRHTLCLSSVKTSINQTEPVVDRISESNEEIQPLSAAEIKENDDVKEESGGRHEDESEKDRQNDSPVLPVVAQEDLVATSQDPGISSPTRQKLNRARLDVFDSPKAAACGFKSFHSPRRTGLDPSRLATFDSPHAKDEHIYVPEVRRQKVSRLSVEEHFSDAQSLGSTSQITVKRDKKTISETLDRRVEISRNDDHFSDSRSLGSCSTMRNERKNRRKSIELELMSPTKSKRASLTPPPEQMSKKEVRKATAESRARVRAKIRRINASRLSTSAGHDDESVVSTTSQATKIKNVYKSRKSLDGSKSQGRSRRADYKTHAKEFLKQDSDEWIKTSSSWGEASPEPIDVVLPDERGSRHQRAGKSVAISSDLFPSKTERQNEDTGPVNLNLVESRQMIQKLEKQLVGQNGGTCEEKRTHDNAQGILSPAPRGNPVSQDSPWNSSVIAHLEKLRESSSTSPTNDAYGERPWRRDMMIREVDAVNSRLRQDCDAGTSSKSSLSAGNDELIDFFLPLMGTGGQSEVLCNKDQPTSISNILRPWQVSFLEEFGILRGEQLVKAHHRSSSALATALRHYRKKRGMASFRTKSCAMALAIWSKTCKAFVRSIRKQLEILSVEELKVPNTLYILSSFLEKIPVQEAEAVRTISPKNLVDGDQEQGEMLSKKLVSI